ncbi:hypothetical protein GCM10027514_15160 [Azotobacter armeniacus]
MPCTIWCAPMCSNLKAVLVLDETGFLKQGHASCGVARQYSGSAGKIANCQIGVFAAYVPRHGHAFIDRALYLPEAWTDDPLRMAAAPVPEGMGFSTRPQSALQMIERALTAQAPFAWIAADTVYGVGAIETALRRAGKGCLLGVLMPSTPGSIGLQSPLQPSRLLMICRLLPGNGYRQAKALRDRVS